MDPCKILIFGDQPLFREVVRQSVLPSPVSFLECADESHAMSLLGLEKPHIAIFYDDTARFRLLRQVTRISYRTKSIVFSKKKDENHVDQAFKLGAKALLHGDESMPHLRSAVKAVLDGRIYFKCGLPHYDPLGINRISMPDSGGSFSSREEKILNLIFEGKNLSDVAICLCVSHKTISNNCTAIKKKMGLCTKADLWRFAVERGRANAIG